MRRLARVLTLEVGSKLSVPPGMDQIEREVVRVVTALRDITVERDQARSDLEVARSELEHARREHEAEAARTRAEITYGERIIASLRLERDDLLAEMAKGADPERIAEAAAESSATYESSDTMCDECGDMACQRCDECHDCEETICASDDGPQSAPAVSSTAATAIASMHAVMATWSGDWSTNKGLAWLYALVVGWGSATQEIADRYGWTEETVTRLADMHAALVRAAGGGR